ncbi:MAG: hypothetical protein JWM11_2932 [Planctomycetaceae bacterium]|nr:hypothetical protein [Planctomycetaceae bacterium]
MGLREFLKRFNLASSGRWVRTFHSPLALVRRGEGLGVRGNRLAPYWKCHFCMFFNHFVVPNHDVYRSPSPPAPLPGVPRRGGKNRQTQG